MPEVGGNKPADKSGAGKSLVEARDTFQTLFEMSRLLNTGLDMETLAICVRLCEQVNLMLSSINLNLNLTCRGRTLRHWPSSSGS